MICDGRSYRNHDGNLRSVIKCLEGKAYILRVQFISGTLLIDELEADGSTWSHKDMLVDLDKEVGNMWIEGEDTYLGTYKSYEEADQASDDYIDSF